jgi:IS5 family transposase
MVGLLILKHLRNVSDEGIVEQWSENVYYQYFCGMEEFNSEPPCASSELVHFRKRIGESGIELIFHESVRVNGDDSNDPHVNVDTTVQEKNITFPTDTKLQKKVIDKCLKIAKKEKLTLRQTYTQTLKKLYIDLRFSKHPKNRKKVKKARRSIKTIAGRLVRELKRLLPDHPDYKELLSLYEQVINQQRDTKNKIYSLHETEVCCISKGKEHKMYEFGNKASFVVTQTTGVIVGAMSFRNEYDGNTLEPALTQASQLRKTKIKTATVDRGYRGNTEINDIKIQLPKPFSKKQTDYEKRRLKKAHTRRAAIEPVIGHIKTDHRLGRNFYKGVMGDSINILLSAAAFNFKRMMNKYKISFLQFFESIVNAIFSNHKNLRIELIPSFCNY